MHPIARKNLHLLFLLLLMSAPLQEVMANDPASMKAVLFYPSFCAECPAVIDEFLMPLTAQQGARLELFPVDITEAPGDQVFKQVLERYGARPDSWERPAVLSGGLLLRGEQEILAQLPALLAADQTPQLSNWPDFAGLQQLINGEEYNSAAETENASDSIATGLAWTVLLAMLLSLSYSIWRLAKKGHALLDIPAINSWSLPLFALLGLGIGVYLSSAALSHSDAMCGPIGDCLSVQASPYSKMLGIPMSMWGVVFYLGILFLWAMQRLRTGHWGQRATLGLLAFSIFGVMFSIYLTSLELFVIHAVCIWCISSAVLATLIMLTGMFKATMACNPCAEV